MELMATLQPESARIGDARSIQALVNGYASQEIMLPKSLSEIYSNIREFKVVRGDEDQLLACGALSIMWEDLAEVCSLAVASGQKGKGLGRLLVDALIEDARQLGIRRVFALTYQLDFFARLGFREIEKSELPHKIWSDCLKCSKFPECDEIAVVLELESAGRKDV